MRHEDLTAAVVEAGTKEARPVNRARGARMAVLVGPQEGAANFVTRRFVLEPGGRIPAHSHDAIEHEQVVVRGEMVLGLGARQVTARAGDAVFIPAGTPHWYENRGEDAVEFICVVPATDGYTTTWHEEPPDGAHLEP